MSHISPTLDGIHSRNLLRKMAEYPNEVLSGSRGQSKWLEDNVEGVKVGGGDLYRYRKGSDPYRAYKQPSDWHRVAISAHQNAVPQEQFQKLIERVDELGKLESVVDELRSQIESFKKIFGFGSYKEIQASNVRSEEKYRESHPNSYLAIDTKTGKLLAADQDEEAFYQALKRHVGNENLLLTNTFDGTGRG